MQWTLKREKIYRSMFSWPRHYLEVCGPLHELVTLPPRNPPEAFETCICWLFWTQANRIRSINHPFCNGEWWRQVRSPSLGTIQLFIPIFAFVQLSISGRLLLSGQLNISPGSTCIPPVYYQAGCQNPQLTQLLSCNHCVALVRTDVSEELSVSIIRVTRISGLGTTLAVTSNRHMLQWN
jgi:hypothetical protein